MGWGGERQRVIRTERNDCRDSRFLFIFVVRIDRWTKKRSEDQPCVFPRGVLRGPLRRALAPKLERERDRETKRKRAC